jgi:hypothetical protein
MIYKFGARARLDWMFGLALFCFLIRVLVMMLCSLFDIDIPFDGRESNKSGLDFHRFGLCK